MTLNIILLLSVVKAIHVTIASSQYVTVHTTIGNITGQTETISFNGTQHSLIAFLGIPYAEPPTGDRRFHKPIKKAAFTEPFTAVTMAPACYQSLTPTFDYGLDYEKLNFSEDCLFLNIFLPGQDMTAQEPRAVMLWIHGGAFQTGYQDLYDGKAVVALNDVILVTMNYRLSVLGFLSTGDNNLSGNCGLWDQHMAIQWVHDHIDRFGGDPNRITLFGESAGSASVMYQTLFEGNQGLFQRVILQSGVVSNEWAFDINPSATYAQFARDSDCIRDSHLDIIKCIREILADAIKFHDITPVVDGEFIEVNPSDIFLNKTSNASKLLKAFSQYDVIIGINSAEGGLVVTGMIDPMASKGGEDTSEGYSVSVFETLSIPFVPVLIKRNVSLSLHNAIVHQYIDWSDPTNRKSVLKSTVDLISDVSINAGVIQAANSRAGVSGNENLYFYVFDYKAKPTLFPYDERYAGANHADEIAYVLGFPGGLLSLMLNSSIGDPAVALTQEQLQLSKHMMQYWTNFAKTGNPNDDGSGSSELTHWPKYDSTTQRYIRFTSNLTSFPVESRYAASRMHFWNKLVPDLEENCHVQYKSSDKDSVSSANVVYLSLLHLLISLVCGLIIQLL